MTIRYDQLIRTALLADGLVLELTAGRVYTRRLKKSGPRSMPEAFDPDGRPRVSIVVLGGQRTIDFTNDDAMNIFPTVWFHGPDTDDGWQAIEDLVFRVREIAPTVAVSDGTTNGGMELTFADELGTQDDITWPGSIVNYVRLFDSVIWR